jgi:hypothetical protein
MTSASLKRNKEIPDIINKIQISRVDVSVCIQFNDIQTFLKKRVLS